MGFLGIGGSTTGAVVSGVTSFASDYYENRDFTSAVINGAVSAGISLILNPLASMGAGGKRGYLEYMRKDYHTQIGKNFKYESFIFRGITITKCG